MNKDITGRKISIVGHPEVDPDLIMDKQGAIEIAAEFDLDIMEVGNRDGVTLCKLLDYNKMVYDKQKGAKQNKKTVTKLIKINSTIADHDLEIKAKQVTRLLGKENRVKIQILFRGRLVQNIENGKLIVDKLLENIDVQYKIVKPTTREFNNVVIILEKDVQ